MAMLLVQSPAARALRASSRLGMISFSHLWILSKGTGIPLYVYLEIVPFARRNLSFKQIFILTSRSIWNGMSHDLKILWYCFLLYLWIS